LGTLQAAHPELAAQVKVVDAAAHPDISSAAIAQQLSGNAGITEEELSEILAQFSDEEQNYIRELLTQRGQVFSARRFADELAQHHAEIMAMAAQRGIKPEDVYFYIPEGGKSYGMLAMGHRNATGTPVDHYINGASDLKARGLGADTMIVVLDDVAGSGDSLHEAVEGKYDGIKTAHYEGKIVVSPMVSTETANEVFSGKAGKGGVVQNNPNVTYKPRQISEALEESSFFKSLAPLEQDALRRLVGDLGYGKNALSMAFEYMAPDNNNALFGDLVAKHFIANKNRKASKSKKWTRADP
jgi:hypothetical protein